jgi:hypothetical protein
VVIDADRRLSIDDGEAPGISRWNEPAYLPVGLRTRKSGAALKFHEALTRTEVHPKFRPESCEAEVVAGPSRSSRVDGLEDDEIWGSLDQVMTKYSDRGDFEGVAGPSQGASTVIEESLSNTLRQKKSVHFDLAAEQTPAPSRRPRERSPPPKEPRGFTNHFCRGSSRVLRSIKSPPHVRWSSRNDSKVDDGDAEGYASPKRWSLEGHFGNFSSSSFSADGCPKLDLDLDGNLKMVEVRDEEEVSPSATSSTAAVLPEWRLDTNPSVVGPQMSAKTAGKQPVRPYGASIDVHDDEAISPTTIPPPPIPRKSSKRKLLSFGRGSSCDDSSEAKSEEKSEPSEPNGSSEANAIPKDSKQPSSPTTPIRYGTSQLEFPGVLKAAVKKTSIESGMGAMSMEQALDSAPGQAGIQV